MSKKQKKHLQRILFTAPLFIIGLIADTWFEADFPYEALGIRALFIVTYLIIGYDIVLKAVRNIARGQVFDENFLMMVATIGAFWLGEYEEAVGVMLFYQVGELFQSYAVGKSRKSIAALMDIRPDYANLMRAGKLIQVDPEEVKINDIIVVKPGERIPLDGIITEGYSAVDTSALTGESLPRDVQEGSEVISGCINQTGMLTIKVSKEFGQSTVAKILDLVENSSNKKSRSEAFITRFARYYTPVVVIVAVALAILPPLYYGESFEPWIYRAMTFLVISCPCALVISVPLSFFGGIGGASKAGVLVKGSNYLEALADAEMVVFDKTGTLTKGEFAVAQIETKGLTKAEFLKYAAYAENYSNHPIALSVKKAYGEEIDQKKVSDIVEFPGLGVKANVDGKTVLIGNSKLLGAENISYSQNAPEGTILHVALDGVYVGYMLIEDQIKTDAAKAINDLRAAGMKKLVMLTGDIDAVGQKVAQRLGLDRAYTELLPADKVNIVEELMQQRSTNGKLAFVGDGINDAPVLARADIGIAMGGLGSDAAIEAADVVLMTDEPSQISTAIKIAQKTLRIVKQNIVFAIGVKGIVLVFGAIGYASMWAAVFADVGVTVIAILNAVRALNINEFNNTKEIKQSINDKVDLLTA